MDRPPQFLLLLEETRDSLLAFREEMHSGASVSRAAQPLYFNYYARRITRAAEDALAYGEARPGASFLRRLEGVAEAMRDFARSAESGNTSNAKALGRIFKAQAAVLQHAISDALSGQDLTPRHAAWARRHGRQRHRAA